MMIFPDDVNVHCQGIFYVYKYPQMHRYVFTSKNILVKDTHMQVYL